MYPVPTKLMRRTREAETKPTSPNSRLKKREETLMKRSLESRGFGVIVASAEKSPIYKTDAFAGENLY
jgi:hypothetical protein